MLSLTLYSCRDQPTNDDRTAHQRPRPRDIETCASPPAERTLIDPPPRSRRGKTRTDFILEARARPPAAEDTLLRARAANGGWGPKAYAAFPGPPGTAALRGQNARLAAQDDCGTPLPPGAKA